jgi:hypothetical protein
MFFYKKRFIWNNHRAMLIPLIQIMFVVLKWQSMVWNKHQEHGSIGLAISYSLLALIAVKLIPVYLFT